MTTIILIISFLIFLKLFLFWLWLWQLKEYHWGRFKAHFQDGQAFKKIISGFWRKKLPKFTKKVIVIFFSGAFLVSWLFSKLSFLPEKELYFFLLSLIVLTPVIWSLFILLFQLPAAFWRRGLVKKAKRKRGEFQDLLVVGITGSYGKTSTKEFLAAILAEKFGENKVLKTKEHQNSEVGIAQCILRDLKPEHKIFVCEMAAYNLGGIKLNCVIARPEIGVITGINEQHMATFGSQENIIKAKFELIESLPEDGTAFFNGKNELLRRFAAEYPCGQVLSAEVSSPQSGEVFMFRNKHCLELYRKTKIKKYLYGQEAKSFGEENILGAMAVAKELGMTKEEINSACQKIKNKLPGIELKRGVSGLMVFDATYSANPDSVIGHLDYLKTLRGSPEGELSVPYGVKKIIVMPCLIELGKASKEVHRRIGRKIAEVCDLAIITTKDKFKEIKESASREAGDREVEILFLKKPKEIFEKIRTFLRKNLDSSPVGLELKSTTKTGDVALLEGRLPKQIINFLLGQK